MKLYTTHFGVLASVHQPYKSASVYIINEQGHEVVMTRKFQQVDTVKAKAESFIGEQVNIITSTHTNNWSSAKYFCDIELV